MKCRIPCVSVRNFRAKVVLPAPLGPAMVIQRGLISRFVPMLNGQALTFLPVFPTKPASVLANISFTAAINALSSKPHSA